MISNESRMPEIGMSGSKSGERKRGYARDGGTGTKRKPPANGYSLTLRQARLSPTPQ